MAANTTRIPTSTTDMIHCARSVVCTPKITAAAMTRNQTDPTSVTSRVLFAWSGANRATVIWPAGRAPATMNTVAEITSAQPAKKPRSGCRPRATQEKDAPAWLSTLARWLNANAMPSIGMPHHSSAAGAPTPAAPIRRAVLAAIEYAGALPATAISVEPALETPPAWSACS